MIAVLNNEKIEKLLRSQFVGRLGCVTARSMYIVPISYAYDGKYIYCHSFEGKKIEMMRQNPSVCFQIDHMKNLANWECVICWGEFEEIIEPAEKKLALKVLLDRQLPFLSSITTHLGNDWPFSHDGTLDEIPGVFFRVHLQEKTGRFEKESETMTAYF